jgi:hypothetical protein
MQSNPILKKTLPEPQRPETLPKSAQWLAGEGAGSWFYIEEKDVKFYIERISPKGEIECEGLFVIENSEQKLNLNIPYKFIHLSHCAFVNIEQGGDIIKLNRIGFTQRH